MSFDLFGITFHPALALWIAGGYMLGTLAGRLHNRLDRRRQK